MARKILVLNGSPVVNGNTAMLVGWFAEGAKSEGARIEVVNTAYLKYKSTGCTSCRTCQRIEKYECAVNDEARPVLAKMIDMDVIVMATPLYFFGPSAQIKLVFDRMFSLYKWDNEKNTMQSPLKGKTLVLIASAYEDVGLKELEAPFKITAEYTRMKFESLLVPNAGVSGNIVKSSGAREAAIELGRKVSAETVKSK